MTDGIVQVSPDSTGKKVDTSELTVGANTVERQRIVVADDTTAAGVGKVQNASPGSGDYGLTVRPAGDVNVVLNAASITSAATLGSWDTAGYQSFNFTIAGTYSGTVTIEISDDNTNWNQAYYFSATSTLATAALGANFNSTNIANGYGPVRSRYIRFRCSAFTSNTSSAVTFILRTMPLYPELVGVSTIISTVSMVPALASVTLTGAAATTTTFVKSAATTNATSIKASAGNLFSMYLINNSAAVKYFKLYNKASAPTVGTDVPVAVVGIPASGNNFVMDGSTWAAMRFTTGIAYAITGAVTDADTTAVAVNDVSGWMVWA